MKKAQSFPYQLLVCPTCNGTGYLNDETCTSCHGLPAAAWTGQELLIWGKPFSFSHRAQEKIQVFVSKVINLGLLLFGVLGVVSFAWTLLLFISTGLAPWFFYQARNEQMFIFWLSLVGDMYLYYRFQRDIERIKHIPKKTYQPSAYSTPGPISWQAAQELPPKQKIDISQYFTQEASEVVSKAWELTYRYEDQATGPIHLFVSLLSFTQAQITLSRLGIHFDKLKHHIRMLLVKQPTLTSPSVYISTAVWETIFYSYHLAYQLHQKKVAVTELLEALVSQSSDVAEILYELDITLDKIKNVIAWLRINKQLRARWLAFRHRAQLRPKNAMNRAMTAVETPVLDAFSQDLTMLARNGYLLPCIGRDKEIADVFDIASGGTRRSVLLIGQSGVGKNTILEGIAQRMVEEQVPPFLQDKRLVKLDAARLVSGASPAKAQQRLLIIINEIKKAGNIVLFIPDIHTLVGISAGRQGSIDVADVIAQALKKNAIIIFSSTTPEAYRRYLEGKSSLDTVLEPLTINEVSGNEAIQILESKVGALEYRYHVFFSYDAIAKTVELSNRYLHDRYLPEKAIEILQETATHVAGQKGKNAIISANDIAQIISAKTNIPLTEITQEESEKLLNLEKRIHQRMVNQVEAVTMVSASLRRARAEMREAVRPIASFLFLGPTGVGKTELAKTVAEVYFGSEKQMVRVDMSEYQTKESVDRFLGDESQGSGYLTEAVRKNPFTLVLLDEFEKAHPDILNVFLQVMDDGRLTDARGRTVDFTNTIIIATSNAGSTFIQEQIKQGVGVETIAKALSDRYLKESFRPELLNRFDGIVVFKPLGLAEVEQIAQLMFAKIRTQLESKGITLKIRKQAIWELARAGFDPQFGARPLRRVMQERVQNPIADQLLAEKVKRRDTVVLEAGGVIRVEKGSPL